MIFERWNTAFGGDGEIGEYMLEYQRGGGSHWIHVGQHVETGSTTTHISVDVSLHLDGNYRFRIIPVDLEGRSGEPSPSTEYEFNLLTEGMQDDDRVEHVILYMYMYMFMFTFM